MHEYIQAGITLMAVINPVICGVMLLQIDGKASFKYRLHDATRAAVAIFLILMLSALLGKYILQIFGISINVFKIVGGVIISFIGFGMFTGKSASDLEGETTQKTVSTLIMFAASPGTIATVIALSVIHTATAAPVVAMVGITFAVFLTWIIMIVMMLAADRIHTSGQKVFARFLGLILIAMGLQFVLTGLKDFMAG
jgi:multiple antibiotic resistance protein